jgi:hypothetical protein
MANFTDNARVSLWVAKSVLVSRASPGYIEQTMLSQYDGPIPILYKRYIDDILGVFTGSRHDLDMFIHHVSNYHDSIKFTHEVSESNLPFLDLKLSIEGDSIISSIHFKETDSHNFLRFDSSHPPACKKSIPYSQILRAKRICSRQDDFDSTAKEMIGFFHGRGYPANIT